MEGEYPSGSFGDTSVTFGQAVLGAKKMFANIPVANDTLADQGANLESHLFSRIGDAFAKKEEQQCASGSGASNEVTGLFRATTGGGNSLLTSNLGSASGSYVIIDNMTTALYSIPQAYRTDAVLIVTDVLAATLRKTRGTNNEALWQPSTQAGQPDLFMGKKVYNISAIAPTWGANNVVGAFVSPSVITLGDRGAFSITRDTSRLIDRDQTLFVARKRFDMAIKDGNGVCKLVANVA
jgi:HK97 family phage major capsid protein